MRPRTFITEPAPTARPESAHQKSAHQKSAHQKSAHQNSAHQNSAHQQSAHPDAAHQDAYDQLADDADYYRRALRNLVEIAEDFACMLQQHEKSRMMAAVAAGQTIPAPDSVAALDRVSRCIRRTVLLSHKLAQPMPARAPTRADTQRIVARRRVLRAVENDIQRHADGPDRETLHEELLERLDAPEIDDEIDNRPVAEIIAEIRDDLGLCTPLGQKPSVPRRTPADIATLCARAARTDPTCFKTARGPTPWSPA